MLGLSFWGMPNIFWVYSVVAVAVGVGALLISRIFPLHSFRRDLARDIGIACLVAVIVSLIYEKSTRSIAEHETSIDTLNKAMASFVPPDVWTEVTKQVMSKNLLRRNVKINMKLLRDGELAGGQKIAMPEGKAVLWMSYQYDLYGLTAGSSKVEVRHELDYHMWDETLRLPRFERVVLLSQGQELKRYEGDSLKLVDDQKGTVYLNQQYAVSLPPPDSNIPVTITTERYELVNVPGAYNLIMPELVARSAGQDAHTITITIDALPDDIESSVNTYYTPHEFQRPDASKYFWTYDNIMLPGQGLSVVFKPRAHPQAPDLPAKPAVSGS